MTLMPSGTQHIRYLPAPPLCCSFSSGSDVVDDALTIDNNTNISQRYAKQCFLFIKANRPTQSRNTVVTIPPLHTQDQQAYVTACRRMSSDWDIAVPRGKKRQEFVQRIYMNAVNSKSDLQSLPVSWRYFLMV